MREIKFRIWDKKRGILVSPEDNTHNADYNFEGWNVSDVFAVNYLLKNEDYIWMQYTGLKDKNGKMIYEGDITQYGVVEYNLDLNWDSGGSSHPGFYFSNGYSWEEKGELSYHTGFDDVEVIGNIYENKELLNDKT